MRAQLNLMNYCKCWKSRSWCFQSIVIVVVSAKYLKFLMSILILWRCVHSKHQMLLDFRQVSWPDKITTGVYNPDQLIILAARPAVGETAFVLNIAQNVGTKQNKAVAVFSLEMVDKFSWSCVGIWRDDWFPCFTDRVNWQSKIGIIIMIAQKHWLRHLIYIDDTPGIKLPGDSCTVRKLSQEVEGGLGLIVIDYLQLIAGTRPENRQQEVSDISRQLKSWPRSSKFL